MHGTFPGRRLGTRRGSGQLAVGVDPALAYTVYDLAVAGRHVAGGLGLSRSGKTEFAKALFSSALELKVDESLAEIPPAFDGNGNSAKELSIRSDASSNRSSTNGLAEDSEKSKSSSKV